MHFRCSLSFALLLISLAAHAQGTGSTRPIIGLRKDHDQTIALIGGTVVVRADEVIADATILLQGSTIVAVGKRSSVKIPAGCEEIDCEGQMIYPGLVDAWGEIEVPDPPRDRGTPYWNGNVIPQRNASSALGDDDSANAKLRSQGICVRLIVPSSGIVQGASCAVLTSDKPGRDRLLADRIWQHVQLTVPRDRSRDPYPNSPMGAVALLRQSLYDALWYRDAQETYRRSANVPRPEANAALAILSSDIRDLTFVIDAPNERMAIRANDLAREFSLQLVIKGSGREYRSLEAIVAAARPILVPVNFPAPPNVGVEVVEQKTTQAQLLQWKLGPENPARLVNAGATICLTTADLDDPGDFLKQIRVAVARGLDSQKALAAMTSIPAKLMGLESKCGSVSVGKLANLLITDGDLFEKKTKVLKTWIAGEKYEIEKSAQPKIPSGQWIASLSVASGTPLQLSLQITSKGKAKFASAVASSITDKDGGIELENAVRERHRLSGTIDFSRLDEQWPTGRSRVSVLFTKDPDTKSEDTKSDNAESDNAESDDKTNDKQIVQLSSSWPDGSGSLSIAVPVESKSEPQRSSASEAESDDKDGNKDKAETKPKAEAKTLVDSDNPIDVVYPLAEYGLSKPIAAKGPLIMRGATIWTSGPAGKLENADMLIRDGKIVAIGVGIAAPEDAEVIRVDGKHIAPGIIDCHSHIATDGGINESGQAITAEVRIKDFIDESEPAIYRQLASGVTAVNILHGSANPIGGQNCVIKLRWGESMEGLVMKEAPKGIKFALGENVKQSNGSGSGRYPGSRMGVEQIIRDQLMAARFYEAEHRRYREGERTGLPPRTDLQLEALAEVLRGERWIHCHSYRQDEIVAFLDLLDEFQVQVGTLQHVLEGYKVADRLKQHGAMASTFADWWGYKFEAFDAIPFNGAVMHHEGVTVSFNSDDAELATHLNTEAAKAMKYGGINEQDALKFVTLNPALQLRIAEHTGSLEVGKDADFAVWSAAPLSTTARCEQTWIDGRQYFSLEQDAALRERDLKVRAQLIQEILVARAGMDNAASGDKADSRGTSEESRWLKYDAFCGCGSGKRGARRSE